MMKKIIIFVAALICIFELNFVHAYDNRLEIKDLDLKTYISFDNEQYRMGDEICLNDEIYLNIEVINKSEDVVKFYTSPYKLNNIKLLILDLNKGELLEEKYTKIIEDNDLKKEKPELFKFKETALYNDEILKYRINLADYFNFSRGRFRVKVEFDPFPATTLAHKSIISKPVVLKIIDSLGDSEFKRMISELKEKEEKKTYTPEGTIRCMLDAYKKGDWDMYFLYQNLDSIIFQYDVFREKYRKSSRSMKTKIISEFKDYIINRRDKQIDNYEIIDVYHNHKNKQSVIKCKIKYKEPALYKTYIYSYKLKQKGVKWILIDFDVITYLKKK